MGPRYSQRSDDPSESDYIAVRELLSLMGRHLGGGGLLPLNEATDERIPIVAVIDLDLLADTTDFVNDWSFHSHHP
jgi:hypothetical protein